MCEHPSIGKSWWRPNGSLLAERPYDDDHGRAFPKPGEKGYKLAVRYSGLAGKNIRPMCVPSNSKTTNGGTLGQISDKNGKKNAEYLNGSVDEAIVWQGVAFDAELDSFDLPLASLRARGRASTGGRSASPATPSSGRSPGMSHCVRNARPTPMRRVSSPGGWWSPTPIPWPGRRWLCARRTRAWIFRRDNSCPPNGAARAARNREDDAQGRFSFASVPDEFHLITAHDQGFAWVTSKDLAASGALHWSPGGGSKGH